MSNGLNENIQKSKCCITSKRKKKKLTSGQKYLLRIFVNLWMKLKLLTNCVTNQIVNTFSAPKIGDYKTNRKKKQSLTDFVVPFLQHLIYKIIN